MSANVDTTVRTGSTLSTVTATGREMGLRGPLGIRVNGEMGRMVAPLPYHLLAVGWGGWATTLLGKLSDCPT